MQSLQCPGIENICPEGKKEKVLSFKMELLFNYFVNFFLQFNTAKIEKESRVHHSRESL